MVNVSWLSLNDLFVVSTPERAQHFARRVVATCQDQRAPRKDAHLESWWCCPRQVRRSRRSGKGRGPERQSLEGQSRGPEDQGITILGTPVGRQEFVERELAKIIADHSELLTRIPEVQDLQCAWLLLLYCGAARANFHIRTIRPELTANFAWSHHDQILQCFCNLLRIRLDAVAASAKAATSLPLVAGGLGLRSALRLREAEHWASWADTMKMVWARPS